MEPFELTLVETRREARHVQVISLQRSDGEALPPWDPGAHLELTLPSGARRCYSLCGNPTDKTQYRIGVKRHDQGRGGSIELSELPSGQVLSSSSPINRFGLAAVNSYLFIAGGIGVTPILPMVHAAVSAGARVQALYMGKHTEEMAFGAELRAALPQAVIHDSAQLGRLDLSPHLRSADGHVYVCGPTALIEAVRNEWRALGRPADSLHYELFEGATARPPAAGASAEPFEVQLGEGGVVVPVDPDQSILDALRAAGIARPFSCEEGVCGTCLTGVIAGEPDHRDDLLEEDERASAMLLCVSRSRSTRLVLDVAV